MNGSEWISTKDAFPAEGQEVTAFMSHGQVKQIVKDKKFSGGWKQANCTGWESVTFDPFGITYWRAEIFERPEHWGPKDAPWASRTTSSQESGKPERYADPDDPLNGPKYFTGKPCIERDCKNPAGTAWSPLWCQSCNTKRMARISASLEKMASTVLPA